MMIKSPHFFVVGLFFLGFPMMGWAVPDRPFKNFEDRVRYYQIQILENPKDVDLQLQYARVHFERKNYSDTALWICQKILTELDPRNIEAAYLAGIICLNKEGYYFEKLKKYQDRNVKPSQWKRLLKEANITWKLGHPDEIILDYLHNSPRPTKEKVAFVRLYLLQEAMNWFKKCLIFDPQFHNARKYIDFIEDRHTRIKREAGTEYKGDISIPGK